MKQKFSKDKSIFLYFYGQYIQKKEPSFLKPLCLICLLIMTGCEKNLLRQHHDPFLQKSKADYENLTQPRPSGLPSGGLTPKCQALDSKKNSWASSFEKKVSLHFSESVPLKEIFEAIAKQANVNLVLEPTLSMRKGFIYTARQQPLKEMIPYLCQMAGLRYNVAYDTLIIQEDKPYLQTHSVPFLIGTRQNQNRVSMMTNVLNSASEKGPSTDNGSDTLLTSASTMDFWGELEETLKLILAQNPEKMSLPETKAAPKSASPQPQANYAIHKQAGLISVYASQGQHEAVNGYLTKLKKRTSTQIVIEAKIIEVTLEDVHKTGINWGLLGEQGALFAPLGVYTKPDTSLSSMNPGQNMFTLALRKGDFSAIAQFMEQFGTTRTLSNPRMTVLNNQSAIFKFAKNEVFFRLDVERLIAADGKPDVENTTSQIQTIPIGLVMVVQPSVNLETQEITLTLRPSISKIVAEKEDPAVAIKSDNQVVSKIPIVQIREMDSVLKVHSGEVIVMGGFMEEVVKDQGAGIPGAQDIPILGNLFQARVDERQVTELVIFLKASIVQEETVHPADYHLYQKFTQDPRPLF